MSRRRGSPTLNPDKPPGLPTAGRLPRNESNFVAGVRALFKPHPSTAVVNAHQPDPAFTHAFFKSRRGWRGRIVAGE